MSRAANTLFCIAEIYVGLTWLIWLPILILSIINFVSEFKIFYILSIITFLLLCGVIFLIINEINQFCSYSNAHIINGIICVCFYLFDAVSYFLFFYEEINIWAIFVLMIISDIAFGIIFFPMMLLFSG